MSSTNKTSKLGLSQYIGSDQPKYLTDYNEDMSRIDSYVGKVTRTASVVVGLEASGYTAEQVDVLIPSGTADCQPYINIAFDRLNTMGGEIKFLEGVYTFLSAIKINSTDKPVKNITIRGCGGSTVLKVLVDFSVEAIKTYGDFGTVMISDIVIGSLGSIIWGKGNGTIFLNNVNATDNNTVQTVEDNNGVKYYVSNCSELSFFKNASNWRNIYIDGVAEYAYRDNVNIIVPKNQKVIVAQDYSPLKGDEWIITLREANASSLISSSYFINSELPYIEGRTFTTTESGYQLNGYLQYNESTKSIEATVFKEFLPDRSSYVDADIVVNSVIIRRHTK